MQDLLNSESNDEIDQRELFMTLWAFKLFIAVTSVLGIIFAGYYVRIADKEFSSTAIFKLGQESSGGVSVGGEISALASLAGFGNAIVASPLPVDQVFGRIFIQNLDAKLDFYADPYFNTYNPPPVRTRGLISSMFLYEFPNFDT